MLEAEGLGQEVHVGGVLVVAAEGFLRIAGHEDHRDLRAHALQIPHQGRTVHVGHHHVGDQKMNGAGMIAHQFQRFLAAGRFQHLVAANAQGARREAANRFLIFHQQHRVLPGDVARRRAFHLRHRHFAFEARQEDRECRALVQFAVDGDVTAGLLDDAVHRRKTEARALSDRLGGEERIEDFADMLLGDAAALIGDIDAHIIVRRHDRGAEGGGLRHALVRGANGNGAALGHRVARIHDEIHDRVRKLRFIGVDGPQVRRVLQLDLNAFADEAAEQLMHFGDGAVQRQHLGLHRLLAAEGKKLLDQIGGAQGILMDEVDLVERRIARGVAHQQEFGIADDDGENVVEVVRHAARKLAHRLHLLRLREFRFQRLLIGNIDQIENDAART